MVNNANIRKLAEQEHFHNVGTSVDQSPKLTEEKPQPPPPTTTTTQPPSTTTATQPSTRSPTNEKKTKERDVKISVNPSRPWYMEGGGRRPSNNSDRNIMSLFPEDIPNSDRIPGENYINMLASWPDFGFYVVLNWGTTTIFCSTLSTCLQYFRLNDALFLMYAKICILHTSKRESFKVAKHFRTTYVPAAERFHTWKYWGKFFPPTIHDFLYEFLS